MLDLLSSLLQRHLTMNFLQTKLITASFTDSRQRFCYTEFVTGYSGKKNLVLVSLVIRLSNFEITNKNFLFLLQNKIAVYHRYSQAPESTK